ncbi:unnamed protein product [Cunninghamella blakesleeana]
MVIGSTPINSISPGMYGIRTLDYEFIIPGPGGDQYPIIATSEIGSFGQIWYVLEDENYPNQFYIQNVSSKKYLFVIKDHIYLHPERYTRFKIQNVKDFTYTIQLSNSELQWISTTKNSSSKDIILSSTHCDKNNQFQFLMVLN